MSKEVAEIKAGIDELTLQQLNFYLEKLKPMVEYYNKLEGLSKDARLNAQQKITDFAMSLKMGKLDVDSLDAFFRRPYPKLQEYRDFKGRLVPNTWLLTVPRFIPLNVGFLVSQDEAWNYFRVNRYMDWFGEFPEWIKKEIGWKEAPDLKIVGEELVGNSEALVLMKKKLGSMVHEKEGKVLVNPDRYYDLIVTLLKEGVKPFSDNPIDPADFVERKCDYELRQYQKEIWNILCKKSNIGVFIPPGTGKTVVGVYAATHLKPPHAIVVPTITLIEQWEQRIQDHTDLKLDEEIFVTTYISAIKRFENKQFTLKVYDEVHHIPARYYIKLTGLKAKYGIGLSATPYREDEGGEELIFALTGEPTGLSWQYFKELNIIKSPTCYIWVEKNVEAKLKRLNTLLQVQKKTVIFSDSLELGKSVAARYNIPFVHGASIERLKTLEENLMVVVSRVGDEGVSLPDIERVIEISWLFGCYDDKTELLTKDGWKPFAAVNRFDEIATLDPSGLMEYHYPTDIQSYEYDGEMIQFGGFHSSYDLLVTPEHSMYVRGRGAGKKIQSFRFRRADELARAVMHTPSYWELKKDVRWSGSEPEYFELPPLKRTDWIDSRMAKYDEATKLKGRGFTTKEIAKLISSNYWTVHNWFNGACPTNKQFRAKATQKVPIEPWLELLAWYLAEGSVDHGRAVKIAQTKPNHRMIADVVRRAGFTPVVREDAVMVYSKQLAQYMERFGHAEMKYVPAFVKELSPRLLKIFLRTMLLGDGHKNQYYTSSKVLADEIQELAIKAGYSATMLTRVRAAVASIRGRAIQSAFPSHEVTLSEKNITPQVWKAEKSHYAGMVYDVTVPNHVLLVRRNGKTVWCGNSRRQELQRFTRLLHGQKVEGEANVIMTLEEFIRDRKRLYSVMDRGFKIEVRREGVTEKTIQREEGMRRMTQPERAEGRATEGRAESRVGLPERGSGTSAGAAPASSLPTSITQRFPGIEKRLTVMSEIQRQVVSTVCGNPGHGYSTQELSLVTGFAVNTLRNRVNFSKLQKDGYIKKDGGKWWSAL